MTHSLFGIDERDLLISSTAAQYRLVLGQRSLYRNDLKAFERLLRDLKANDRTSEQPA